MQLVILESPYAGDIKRNEAYLARCIRDSIGRGEAPFASHRMYPGALSEVTEREKGIRAGFAWWKAAHKIVFYTDLGWSPGMHKAKQRANTMKIRIEERSLDRVGKGIFKDHSCWKCKDGLNPCVQGPGGCEYPHARHD